MQEVGTLCRSPMEDWYYLVPKQILLSWKALSHWSCWLSSASWEIYHRKHGFCHLRDCLHHTARSGDPEPHFLGCSYCFLSITTCCFLHPLFSYILPLAYLDVGTSVPAVSFFQWQYFWKFHSEAKVSLVVLSYWWYYLPLRMNLIGPLGDGKQDRYVLK
jgi:hypothetical protein